MRTRYLHSWKRHSPRFHQSVNIAAHEKWRGGSKRLARAHTKKKLKHSLPVSAEPRLLYGGNRMPSKYKRRYTSGGKRCNTHFKQHFQLIPTFTQPSQPTADTLPTGFLATDVHPEEKGRKTVRGHGQHLRPFRWPNQSSQARWPRHLLLTAAKATQNGRLLPSRPQISAR